ncbi:MAG: hypothetical protein HYX78_05290 [Armatimonadetes bacterium]|nr:hypothetical protein [Armatimonadota bacterium]
MVRLLCVLISSFLLLVLISPVKADQVAVGIKSSAFVPANVSIFVGDSVRWTNQDQVVHTSTSGSGNPPVPDGNWNSGTLGNSSSFTHVFTDAGAFPYYCGFHAFMRGSVTAVAPVTVGQAKALLDSTTTGLQGVVITALTSGGFYVESDDRSAGVFISSTFSGSVGQVVDVIGAISTTGGRKQLDASTVRLSSDQSKTVAPLAMSNRSVAGPPSTEGLLVKVWGRVASDQGVDYFRIDDGSSSGSAGLKIASGSLTKPAPGTYVAVTGISSFEGSPSARIIVARDQLDIVPASSP